MAYPTASSTSKNGIPLLAGLLITLVCVLVATLQYGLRYGVALAAVAVVFLAVLAYRATTPRRRRLEQIEPSFDTSILVFPPESRLGPRPMRRR